MVDSQIRERRIDPKELARIEKARYLNERIDQHNDLAHSTKDVRKWLRESAVMMGDDDMVEWHEEKGDEFFYFADFYEREVSKAFKELPCDRSKES